MRRISLRDEWFEDADGTQHNRVIDAEDGAVFCDHDNEFWPCSAARASRDETVQSDSQVEERYRLNPNMPTHHNDSRAET